MQGVEKKKPFEITPERLVSWFGVPYPFQPMEAIVTNKCGFCRA
jgi:hypothetical protein